MMMSKASVRRPPNFHVHMIYHVNYRAEVRFEKPFREYDVNPIRLIRESLNESLSDLRRLQLHQRLSVRLRRQLTIF